MKVHGSLFATAPMRVLACLFEKDLDFEFVHVDLCAEDHKKEPFLSLNVSRLHTFTCSLFFLQTLKELAVACNV